MTNINQTEKFKIDNNEIEIAAEYKYLGQIISWESRTKNEIKVGKANAWKASWAHKSILEGKLILKSKIKILASSVYPMLMYRAQTWTYTVE